MTQTPNQMPHPAPRRMNRLRTALAAGATTAVLALAGAGLAHAMPGGHGMHGDGPGAMGRHEGMGMGMGMPMGGGMMPGHPRHLARALDNVGASAEQKGQIARIFEAARNDLRAQREGGQALHQQARALLTQPNIDARAAEALRQQMLARHDQASKRMLQATLEAAQVLTPEQRQKLAAQLDQRRALMQRHRSEREALEKAPR